MTVNTLGSPEQYRSSRTDSSRIAPPRTVAEWLWPFLPMGIAAFSLSAVFWYHKHRDTIEVRAPLQRLYAGVYDAFGLAPSVLFFLLVLIWSAIWLVTGRLERPFARLGRLVAMLVMLGMFLNIGDGGVAPAPNKGALGAWLAGNLVGTFGYVPSLIVVWAITFASLLLATDFFFHDAFERLRQKPAGQAPDAGVEIAVTDHLRGLSAAVAPPVASFATAPLASTAAIAEPEVVPLDVEPESAPEPDVEGAAGRRRSYFERRAEREGRPTEQLAEPWAGSPAEAQLEPPIDRPIERTGAHPVEALAAADAADLAIDDALPLDGPLDRQLDAPENETAAETAPTDVYETPEALEAAEALDEAMAEAEDAGSGERWVPIPRPEPAAPAEPAENPIAEIPIAEMPVGELPVAEASGAEESDAETAAVEAAIAPQPARDGEEAEPEPRIKQQRLFGGGLDDGLVQDAIDVVTSSRRASAVFLQRKLRIDYALAVDVLAELAARGVVELDDDATQGRVLG